MKSIRAENTFDAKDVAPHKPHSVHINLSKFARRAKGCKKTSNPSLVEKKETAKNECDGDSTQLKHTRKMHDVFLAICTKRLVNTRRPVVGKCAQPFEPTEFSAFVSLFATANRAQKHMSGSL